MRAIIALAFVFGFASANPIELQSDSMENRDNLKIDIICTINAIKKIIDCIKNKTESDQMEKLMLLSPEFALSSESWADTYSFEYFWEIIVFYCPECDSSDSEYDSNNPEPARSESHSCESYPSTAENEESTTSYSEYESDTTEPSQSENHSSESYVSTAENEESTTPDSEYESDTPEPARSESHSSESYVSTAENEESTTPDSEYKSDTPELLQSVNHLSESYVSMEKNNEKGPNVQCLLEAIKDLIVCLFKTEHQSGEIQPSNYKDTMNYLRYKLKK